MTFEVHLDWHPSPRGRFVRKKKWFWSLLLLLGTIGLVGGLLGVFLKQEPNFYLREISAGPSVDDQSTAINTLVRASNLQDAIFRSAEWGETFTADEWNAVLRENLTSRNDLSSKLFGELSDPRIAIEDDRLKIAFRYGEGFWSTVISMELRLWVVKDEPNTIAIEVVSLSAGAVPLNKQWPLDQLSEAARSQHAEITWYRNKGNPVGLCKLFVDRPQRDARLHGLKLEDGRITLYGRHTLFGEPEAP
jgi:hypothetical protein